MQNEKITIIVLGLALLVACSVIALTFGGQYLENKKAEDFNIGYTKGVTDFSTALLSQIQATGYIDVSLPIADGNTVAIRLQITQLTQQQEDYKIAKLIRDSVRDKGYYIIANPDNNSQQVALVSYQQK